MIVGSYRNCVHTGIAEHELAAAYLPSLAPQIAAHRRHHYHYPTPPQ